MSVTNLMTRQRALRIVPIFHSLAKATLFDVARKTQALRRLLASRGRAAVDGVEAGRIKVDRAEVSALIFGKTLFADAAEDTLSIESSHSVP